MYVNAVQQSFMKLSARNQLPGIVEEIRMGDIMAHVSVRVGEHIVESVITRTGFLHCNTQQHS